LVIKFDTETIRLITLFENITGASVRDCIVNNDLVYYVVDEGKIGIIIGKNGSTIKNAEKIIKKKIKVFEYSKDPVEFVRRMIPQSKEIELIDIGDKKIIEIRVTKNYKPFVIGRGGKNIKIYRKILERNNKIDDIKIK